MEQEMITITKALYESLLEDASWLSWLESAGVDNWEGFEYALQLKRENAE